MAFDTKRFLKTKFEQRTCEVEVKDLADWFSDGAPPIIIVRGLTGEELARINEAAAKNRNLSAVIDAIASTDAAEKIDAIKKTLGVSDSVPDDLAKRIEQLVYGCVDPEFTLELAVKFFEVYPIEGYTLSNTIMRLTGQGQQPGESKPSGTVKK